MSSNKTTNYQLHSWEPGDDFLRSEFNENFAALDTAIKGVETGASSALAGARSALTNQVNAKAEIVAGSYVGTNTDNREITVGFRPKAVLVYSYYGFYYNKNYYGGVVTESEAMVSVALTDTGFSVRHNGSYFMVNSSSYTYFYLAIR